MDPIYEGLIKKNGSLPRRYTVRTLTMDHLSAILNVQEDVIFHLKDKKILQPLTVEEFQFILNGNGFMLGVFIEKTLIAYRALLVPPIDQEHLGLDIGLNENDLEKVIYQELSVVLPAFQGNQLQRTLATLIMEELSKSKHTFRYVCATVALFNIPSLKDKFLQGMEILALKEKYDGRLRYVFSKDLDKGNSRSWIEMKDILMVDVLAQQTLLKEGWRGFKMELKEGAWWITYGIE